MSKRFFVITLTLLSLAGAVVAQDAQQTQATAASQEAAPRLTVVEPVKDFGTVPKGEKLEWAFIIKNTGNKDLEIMNARPGCGCTVTDFDKVIKPGQTGKVTAHVDTTNFTGPIAKPVTIESNDPQNPSAQVTIHAIVKPYVEAYPAGFVRFNILQGDNESQVVTLYSEEDDPFEIVKIETPAPWIKATAEKVDPSAAVPEVGRKGQNQYRLTVTTGGADARIGALAEKIHVITNSKHQPDYFVSVTGVIRPAYRVEPGGVNFGEVTPTDTAATRSVIVRSNSLKAPESFVVTKAVSSVPGVTAQVKPTTTKGEYVVTLQVDKKAKAGDIDGNVTIYTSDSVNPTAVVPVKGTIKKAAAPSSK